MVEDTSERKSVRSAMTVGKNPQTEVPRTVAKEIALVGNEAIGMTGSGMHTLNRLEQPMLHSGTAVTGMNKEKHRLESKRKRKQLK